MQAILPPSIFSRLTLPDWFNHTNKVKRLYLRRDITFNSGLFKAPLNVSEDAIREALAQIIKNDDDLSGNPLAYDYFMHSDGRLLKRGENHTGRRGYMFKTEADMPTREELQKMSSQEAYELVELKYIPVQLAKVLDSSRPFAERYAIFLDLQNNVPVFSKLNTLLLFRVIPEAQLSGMVEARLDMSARGETGVTSTYPRVWSVNAGALFNEILEQNTYLISDRKTYNLRYYIKEDGSLYSLNEIIVNTPEMLAP